MKYFKLKYADGRIEIHKSKDSLSLLRNLDLFTKEHVDARIFQLSGEQLAIAISNEE